jgi:transposase
MDSAPRCTVVLQFPYLALSGVFASSGVLPTSNTDKDIEILVLRHQLTIVQRQISKPRLTPPDRAFLAALPHRIPRPTLRQLHLIISPDTVQRWHRDLLRRHHARASQPKRPGRPPTIRSIRALILRLARENPNWGHRRIHDELTTLAIKIAPSTVWEILRTHGIDPAPRRAQQADLGHVPAPPGTRHPRRRLSSKPEHIPAPDCSPSPSSSTPPAASTVFSMLLDDAIDQRLIPVNPVHRRRRRGRHRDHAARPRRRRRRDQSAATSARSASHRAFRAFPSSSSFASTCLIAAPDTGSRTPAKLSS